MSLTNAQAVSIENSINMAITTGGGEVRGSFFAKAAPSDSPDKAPIVYLYKRDPDLKAKDRNIMLVADDVPQSLIRSVREAFEQVTGRSRNADDPNQLQCVAVPDDIYLAKHRNHLSY